MTSTKRIAEACLIAIFIAPSLSALAQPLQLTRLWETDATLMVPESVLYHPADSTLYVSCIDGQPDAKDMKGTIARVSTDGKILEAAWVQQLNAPKGMAIYQGTLYVADIDEVVAVALNSGEVLGRLRVADATFLNDLTVDDAGVIYASDSGTGKVHRIKGSNITTYLDRKPGVNGLLAVGKELYLAVQDTLFKADGTLKLQVLATGLDASTDGIVKDGPNLIVSCWSGIVYVVQPNGTATMLLDTRPQSENTADLGYDPVTRTLYVPTFWKNTVAAYKIGP